MIAWTKSLIRAWVRWAYLVNGCDPARIDEPEERRRFLVGMRKASKRSLYVTGAMFIVVSPLITIVAPREFTLSQIAAALAAGLVMLLVGIGMLLWAWRT